MSRPASPPAMFRAGTIPGAAVAGVRAAPAAAGPGVLLADCSEFQPDIADAAYLAWSRAVVIRAMYGTSYEDRAWYGGTRRDALHAGGALFTGIYQYLVAGQDAAAQARALVKLLGPLRRGEKIICDIEEGPPGQQAARWRQWSSVITGTYGQAADPWLYAGLYFSGAAGLTPQWVAAYQDNEPGGNHRMWQFTDRYQVPGVGVADCSRFRGTLTDLAACGWQGAKPPPKPPGPPPDQPPNWTEFIMQMLPELRQGATGSFVRTAQFQCGEHGHKITVDGIFGPGTLAAVKAIQAHAGITQDGVVGPKTWSILIAGSL